MIAKGKYLVGPVRFGGPCKAAVSIRVEGTLQAPAEPEKLKSQDGWVVFQNVDKLSVFGGGTFDGQGKLAWSKNNCAKTGKCNSLPIVSLMYPFTINFKLNYLFLTSNILTYILPVALCIQNIRLTGVTNSHIQHITSLNSKLFHMNVINCKHLTLEHITIDAPQESLNTDGIHIGRSSNINVTNANIKTGDDCVSIGDGSQQINVEKVICGPGHGISIGSLGRYVLTEIKRFMSQN